MGNSGEKPPKKGPVTTAKCGGRSPVMGPPTAPPAGDSHPIGAVLGKGGGGRNPPANYRGGWGEPIVAFENNFFSVVGSHRGEPQTLIWGPQPAKLGTQNGIDTGAMDYFSGGTFFLSLGCWGGGGAPSGRGGFGGPSSIALGNFCAETVLRGGDISPAGGRTWGLREPKTLLFIPLRGGGGEKNRGGVSGLCKPPRVVGSC